MAQSWLKVHGSREDPVANDWLLGYEAWHRRYNNVTMFSKRPRINRGDRLVLYASGSPAKYGYGRIYAIEDVIEGPVPTPHER